MISVFGGTGFVGSEFCKQSTRPLERIPRESREPVSNESLYFISTTHNYHVFEDLHRDVDTNLTVLLDVLSHLQKGHTFNFVSSWFVYGETALPAAENSLCHPKGFYSITKKAAEDLLVSYCRTFGINYRILRLCNVYGPGDRDVSARKNALQYLIECLKRHEPIRLYHGGAFVRDYMHVTDVARAIDLCLEKAPLNEIINIGTGHPQNFRDVIFMAKRILKSGSEISSMEPTDFHKLVQVKDFYMNVDKLTHLGFHLMISIEEGIRQLCQ